MESLPAVETWQVPALVPGEPELGQEALKWLTHESGEQIAHPESGNEPTRDGVQKFPMQHRQTQVLSAELPHAPPLQLCVVAGFVPAPLQYESETMLLLESTQFTVRDCEHDEEQVDQDAVVLQE